MNPSLELARNAEQAYLALGLLQFLILWLVAAACTIVLVRVISWWLDR